MAAGEGLENVRNNAEMLEKLLANVEKAQETFATYSQEEVDRIFTQAATAATQARVRLARLAVEESGMGVLEDKTVKNHFAAEFVYNKYKDMKTCGVVERDEFGGIIRSAHPVGILAAIIPCTNPTSTAIFKCLLALKTRNCIVLSPHPRTVKCTVEAARVVRDAAVAAGAPPDCISWLDVPTIELCNQLMRHPRVAMIVATGAAGLVKAAYGSGKPALGGGSGNVPVIIDETADIPMAVNSILLSKTFDNGMVCSSEQAVIAVKSVAEKVKEEFLKRGAFFVNDVEKGRLGSLLLTEKGGLNPNAVGLSAERLADLAQIERAPKNVRLLLGECEQVGPSEKLSHEKLAPCLAFFTAADYDGALARALEMVQYGGMGHTSVLYTDLNGPDKKSRVERFHSVMPTGRALICMPSSQGGIGGIFNFQQAPSMSLCCGTWGGNSTAESLGCKHLLNYKETAERRDHVLWFRVPRSLFFGKGAALDVLSHLADEDAAAAAAVSAGGGARGQQPRRAFVVLDKKGGGAASPEVQLALEVLRSTGIEVEVFDEVEEDGGAMRVDVVRAAVARMNQRPPESLIVIGSGSTIEGGKVIRLLYEHPDAHLDRLRTRFMDIQRRVVKFPRLGVKLKRLVCIPTTSGPGAEMTPFATVIDVCNESEEPHLAPPHLVPPHLAPPHLAPRPSVFALADYSLTPDIAVVDASFVHDARPTDVVAGGWQALANSLESYVSMWASDYTKGYSLRALMLLARHLEKAAAGDATARDACHTAAALGGMAAANAFVGVGSAMATQLSDRFSLPRGMCIALTVCQTVRFNAAIAPARAGTFPQYSTPRAAAEYAELAAGLGLCLPNDPQDVLVDGLLAWLSSLKQVLGVPRSISDCGVSEAAFMEAVDELALAVFDDQATAVNPRYPLVAELRDLFLDAFHGRVVTTH